ncbi:uncharacterized protein LOC141611743 [Silene latifolia]|uniref:uncharacterized protein LOC141611743 n=1 Tax=Silene latifolia TaxID=37657 RepID=UPI003D774544
MNNKQHRKVRYVKCPKCARILPEPEQVPLYTCGGCDTILQAKYYRQQREASVPTLPAEDVQSNGNVHASEVLQSSGDQSPISNKDSNENAVDVGDKICAHPTSLTEESTGLDNKEANSIVGDKEAEKRPIEIETREDGSGQDLYGGDIVVESQDDEQIRNVDYAYEISTRREFEVVKDKKIQQHATVNEATYDDSDKGEQREDIALDKQEEVGNRKFAKEFEPVMQLGTANVAEGYKVSGNEMKCLAEDKLVGVAKLGKEEKSRTEPKSFIERIRGKLAGITLTEVVDGNENPLLPGGEASFGAYASNSTSEIPQNTDCGRSLLENVNGTSRQKTENFDECIVDHVDKAGTSATLNTHNDNLLEGVPRSPTKRSSAYGESVSSSDGNDHQVLGQLDQINREICTERKNEAKEDERDNGEECEDSGLDKQKEVGHANSATVASMAVQYQPNELPEQFGPVNVEGSRGNEINCLAEDVPVGVAKLGKEEKSGKEQKGFIECIREKLASVTSSDEVPVSTEVQNENEHAGVEASLGAASERIASDVPQQPDCEINLTDNVEETWRQNIENLDDFDLSESEQNRPANNAETSETFDRHEKVVSLLGGVRRSPTKRSPAYDGSVSSCDGNDDKVHRQSERLNEGTFSGAEENSEWIGVPLVRTNYVNVRSQARPKSSSYQLSDEKLTRQLRDGVLPPRIPFHRISSEMAFETGSSSSYLHDEPPSHWTRREPYSQMGYMEGRRFTEASWRENEYFPMYYNDEISGDYHRHSSDSRRRSESLFLSGNLPRTQYSGDVYNRKHQIQDPYIHRLPDARRWSTQLPSGPPGYYRHRGPTTYMDPPGEVKWDPYDPYPINPYGWAHDTIYHSDDQRHKERMTKRLHVREKCQAVKRCLRPLAGGAPFITCHFCFTVLQLPEEFLLPKGKKIHKVKCGTCSNILEFSLENDSCLAPRLPYASEADPIRDLKSDSPSRASHSNKSILGPSEALGREKSNSRTDERQAQVTWELPARSKSPLHRLMGYSSPRDLFADDKE